MKSKEQILDEFRLAANASKEHEMHRWKSEDTWLSRFEILFRLIDWEKIETWVDVGCGTGKFFDIVKGKSLKLSSMTGLDALDEYLKIAREKQWGGLSNVNFIQQDIEFIERDFIQRFDLVTIVGVIYVCGVNPEIVVNNVKSLIKKGGTLVITTENPDFYLWPEDVKNEYPSIENIMSAINQGRRPASYNIYYCNPLFNTIEPVETCSQKERFKEIYFYLQF